VSDLVLQELIHQFVYAVIQGCREPLVVGGVLSKRGNRSPGATPGITDLIVDLVVDVVVCSVCSNGDDVVVCIEWEKLDLVDGLKSAF
jgi:hypothetical protein